MGSKEHAKGANGTASIIDAWGVEPKAAPGGRDGRICGMSDGEIDAGEPGGSEPLRRLSGSETARSARGSAERSAGGLGRSARTSVGTRAGNGATGSARKSAQLRMHRCPAKCTGM